MSEIILMSLKIGKRKTMCLAKTKQVGLRRPKQIVKNPIALAKFGPRESRDLVRSVVLIFESPNMYDFCSIVPFYKIDH